MEKRYYIAYGSNLNIPQMRMRCPGARIIGTSEINDYQLLFKGSKTGSYLTIEPKEGSRVPVAAWEVTAEDEAALDRYEGYPTFYYKKEMKLPITGIRSGKVRIRNTFVYIMHDDRPLGLPSSHYLRPAWQDTAALGSMKGSLSGPILTAGWSWKEDWMMKIDANTRIKICSRCGNAYHGAPALSREDNETLICPDCGTREALESIGVDADEQESIISIIHGCGDRGGL